MTIDLKSRARLLDESKHKQTIELLKTIANKPTESHEDLKEPLNGLRKTARSQALLAAFNLKTFRGLEASINKLNEELKGVVKSPDHIEDLEQATIFILKRLDVQIKINMAILYSILELQKGPNKE